MLARNRFEGERNAEAIRARCAVRGGPSFDPHRDGRRSRVQPGSSGLGDPFFPNAGNGGYDVSHYSLTLGYEPASNQLAGTALITATATQDLSRFDLDLRGFSISRLNVNGHAASFTREGEQELVITPSAGLSSGSEFTVTIDYAGTP